MKSEVRAQRLERAARWLVAALGALLVATPLRAQDEIGIKRGSPAPGAIVEKLDGSSVDLKSYIGKQPVLIEFWATWCPNCKQLEPAMHAVAKKYAGKVRLIGVAVSVNQSVDRVKAYAEKHALPLEVLYDRRGYASDVYEVPATSYVVVIDAKGTVVYTGVGGDQNLDAAIRKALGG
ncbi:MAG: TlpA family protein disulfide reductase [Gemmatimonadaceae bacterium]